MPARRLVRHCQIAMGLQGAGSPRCPSVWGLCSRNSDSSILKRIHDEGLVMVTKKLEDDERGEGPFAADRAKPGAGSLAENAEPALCPPCTRSPE